MGAEYSQAACPGAPAPKKKTSPLAWLLVAIGAVLLLFGIGIIAGGLFLFHTVAPGGAAKLPDWVPVYTGVKPDVAAAGESAERSRGAYQFTTRDSASTVADYYKTALEKAGFTINAATAQPGVAIVSGGDDAGGRMVNVTLVSEGQETRVHVVYSQTK